MDYMEFFKKQNTGSLTKEEKPLSFSQLIDIINTDYNEDILSQNNQRCAGGYSI